MGERYSYDMVHLTLSRHITTNVYLINCMIASHQVGLPLSHSHSSYADNKAWNSDRYEAAFQVQTSTQLDSSCLLEQAR